MVNTVARAEAFVAAVKAMPRGTMFGCDTEVAIDLDTQSPVGNGQVTCISVYAGPQLSFGDGTHVWIDLLDGEKGVLEAVKPFFESAEVNNKVWHNYAFDRHVLYNHGVDCQGLAGDTMHMARLMDNSRDRASGGGSGYSLESLSVDLLASRGGAFKTGMKELFGVAQPTKSGLPGKIKALPPVVDIQRDASTRERWIKYSCYDAMCTVELYHLIRARLERMEWVKPRDLRPTAKALEQARRAEERRAAPPSAAPGQAVPPLPLPSNLFQLYEQNLLPFATVLTDIEREGFQVDRGHLEAIEKLALRDEEQLAQHFREWLPRSGAFESATDAALFNPDSAAQKQYLFYAKAGLVSASEQAMKTARSRLKRAQDALAGKPPARLYPFQKGALPPPAPPPRSAPELAKLQKQVAELSEALQELQEPKEASFETLNTEGALLEGKRKALKHRTVRVLGMGLPSSVFSPKGWPSVNSVSMRELAGDPEHGKWGSAKDVVDKRFPGAGAGEAACRAIDALARAGAVNKLLQTFIRPLQQRLDAQGRIHCSLNLNTETGRLSSRNPNLQNQPALEKDIYKIRKAFVAREGHSLVVADYGQLELRVLAHLAECKSMIEAFEKGGDFHSRTAIGMYPEIRKDIEAGGVLLEWDSNKGKAPAPLIKNKYANERRRAKVLNFSIAYGKTAHGLSSDFGVSVEEAQAIVDLWYADRPEVQAWQEATKVFAKRTGVVRTLWGRNRPLPDVNSKNAWEVRAAERAAINTPIQGSAADIVMGAMLNLHRNARLRELGWKMILQVHDEVILEGPEESKEEALSITKREMQSPLSFPLLVDLVVDAGTARTWYEAK